MLVHVQAMRISMHAHTPRRPAHLYLRLEQLVLADVGDAQLERPDAAGVAVERRDAAERDARGALEGRAEARKHQAQQQEVDEAGADDLGGAGAVLGVACDSRQEQGCQCWVRACRLSQATRPHCWTVSQRCIASLAGCRAASAQAVPAALLLPVGILTCSMTTRLAPTHVTAG